MMIEADVEVRRGSLTVVGVEGRFRAVYLYLSPVVAFPLLWDQLCVSSRLQAHCNRFRGEFDAKNEEVVVR
jgi:hypothetical protein